MKLKLDVHVYINCAYDGRFWTVGNIVESFNTQVSKNKDHVLTWT